MWTVDLFSAHTDEELRRNRILKDDICFPSCVVFATDHNLAMALSDTQSRNLQARDCLLLGATTDVHYVLPRIRFQLTRIRVVPFRSPKFGTSSLLIEHEIGMRSRRTQ